MIPANSKKLWPGFQHGNDNKTADTTMIKRVFTPIGQLQAHQLEPYQPLPRDVAITVVYGAQNTSLGEYPEERLLPGCWWRFWGP
jgi:hypothetical protein